MLQSLASAREGPGSAQAGERLARHGPNRLARARRRGPALRLQFHNVLLYIMLAAAGITADLGHWVDTAVLLGAVVVHALIGFVQEGKAESAMDAIRFLLSPHAIGFRRTPELLRAAARGQSLASSWWATLVMA